MKLTFNGIEINQLEVKPENYLRDKSKYLHIKEGKGVKIKFALVWIWIAITVLKNDTLSDTFVMFVTKIERNSKKQ